MGEEDTERLEVLLHFTDAVRTDTEMSRLSGWPPPLHLERVRHYRGILVILGCLIVPTAGVQMLPGRSDKQ